MGKLRQVTDNFPLPYTILTNNGYIEVTVGAGVQAAFVSSEPALPFPDKNSSWLDWVIFSLANPNGPIGSPYYSLPFVQNIEPFFSFL